MSESLVVPDLHLKPWIFTRADEIMQQEGVSRAIFLGDLQDDWDEQNNIELYYETNSKLLEFSEKYPQSLFCYGNHDISYWYRREESGYSFRAESMVQSFLMEMRKTLKGRLAFCHMVDQVIFSHAGITKEFVEEYDISGNIRYSFAYIDDDDIPELVFSIWESHAAGASICFYEPSTEKVIKIGEDFGDYGDFDYYERKNTIFNYRYGNGGFSHICFCHIEKDYSVARSSWFTMWTDAEEKTHYDIGDLDDFVEVSEDEYEKEYSTAEQGFTDEELVSLSRNDMSGDYKLLYSQDAVQLLLDTLKK